MKSNIIKKENIMKTKYSRLSILVALTGGLILVSGCVVEPNGIVRVAPVVVAPPVVAVAPPAVEVAAPVVEVPDSYVWDGVEFVGVVGDGYFYLGPGDVWVSCDPVRLGRFHDWERIHPDWRVQVIRNERFRRDARGEFHPMAHGDAERTKVAEKPKENEHLLGHGEPDRGKPAQEQKDAKPQPARHGDDVHQGLGGPETKVAQKPRAEEHQPGHSGSERTKSSQKPKEDERH